MTSPSDLLRMPRSLWRDRSVMPDHRSPGMLYRIEGNGAKRCQLCGKQFPKASQAYHSHAAKHIREGWAEPVETRLYRRWYALTGPGLIHYADRED